MNLYEHPHHGDYQYAGLIPNGRQRFYIERNADDFSNADTQIPRNRFPRAGTDLRPPGFGRNRQNYVANEERSTGVDVEVDQRPSNEPDDVDGRTWSTLSPFEQFRDVIILDDEPDRFVLRTREQQADGIERMVSRVPVHRLYNPVARLPSWMQHRPFLLYNPLGLEPDLDRLALPINPWTDTLPMDQTQAPDE